MKHLTIAAAAALALATPVAAHDHQDQPKVDHSKMDHSKMGAADHARMMQNSAANPYAQSEMRMHERMMKAVGADASETFVRKMIEHHRGGVEISKIAVAQAKDPAARDKASKTMAMQNKEIAELQNWLKTRGKRPQ